MIHEVDDSLRALVQQEVVRDAEVDVAFDAPTREWSSRRSKPAINLFLYDIREDRSRRQYGRVRERDAAGRAVEEQDAPRRLKLSYLATAWTQRPEDEHRLLGALLACLVRYEYLPSEVLAGSLRDAPTTVSLTVGVPSTEDRHVSDLWSAIGGELRPALDVVATTPLYVGVPVPPAPLVLEKTRLNVRTPGGRHLRQGRRAPPDSPSEGVRVEERADVVSAGQPDDDFDAPAPVNDLPRGRSFRMRRSAGPP